MPKRSALGRAERGDGVEVSTSGRIETTSSVRATPFPDFTMQPAMIAPAATSPPTGARRVGDVRTHDRFVSPPDYERLACGWSGDVRQDCRAWEQAVLDALLHDLQRQTAAVDADVAHDVRCFGRNDGGKLRVWCEAVAYLTPRALAASCRAAELSSR
jgi:hypothetical protein